MATKFLCASYQKLQASTEFLVEIDEYDITTWKVGLTPSVIHEALRRDLITWSTQTKHPPVVLLELSFPKDTPHSPPFVRVVRPRFVYHTGHVTIGGSICTEMLTAAGWREMSVETLLRTICLLLADAEPAARVQMKPDMHCATPLVDYTLHEAKLAFDRQLATHGWKAQASEAGDVKWFSLVSDHVPSVHA